jgi:tRNA modification GTPase
LARPGEFSERAFLNGKLDLAQAEAIADLIHASTEKSARAALASLHGEFSQRIHSLSDAINHLRLYVEAAIDFPEEEIDFLGDSHIGHSLNTLIEQLDALRRSTHHGCLLRDGMTVVIIGRPNVGKSSLLNALAGYEAAIVTDQPGTTRDLMRERIQIDGIPIHLTDSAGLRQSNDAIEQEGIRRAWDTVERSQRVLLVTDDQIGMGEEELAILAKIPPEIPVIVIHNKVDLTHTPVGKQTETLAEGRTLTHLYLSARSGAGIELIHAALKTSLGVADQEGSGFLARRRHLVALDQATKAIQAAAGHFNHNLAGELIAEELRQARQALNAITGEFTTEDLLDQIFREFCVGK